MADKEFTQICKEILGVSKRLEKIEPDELRKIKADIEQISATIAAHKASFDASKEDFDGKYSGITEIINTFNELKTQIELVLKSGVINDGVETSVSTFSSKKITELLNKAKSVIEEKIVTLSKSGITAWNTTLEYPIDAVTVFNGKLYRAKTQNTGKKPSENQDEWEAIAGEKWSEKTFQKLTDAIDAYNKQESDERYAQKSDVTDGLKIGSYLLWSSQSVTPAGFLVCDGRSLKKSEYAELFTVIGYTYGGSGDNFNLPNFADGKFMRSIGGNAAALGQVQQDEIKSHTHGVGQQPGIGQSNNGGSGPFAGSNNHIQSGATGGNETRPYNMAVVVLIKAKEVKEPNANQIDKSIYATEAKAGITKLKNSITGKAEDVAVTEKAIAEAFACAKSENGYTRLPNGLILQWGTTTATKVTFPIAFNKRLNVSLTSAEKEGEFAVFIADEALIENPSNTGFSIQTTRIKGTPGDYFKFYWMAIGY